MNRRIFINTIFFSAYSGIILNSCEQDFSIISSNQNSIILDLTNQLSDGLYGKAPGKPRLILDYVGAGFTRRFENINFGIPLIIARVKNDNTENDFSCFSSLCTHMNCTSIRPSLGATLNNRHIVCPCHSSRFDAFDHGKVIQGPAEIPLKEFKTKFDSNLKTLEIFF